MLTRKYGYLFIQICIKTGYFMVFFKIMVRRVIEIQFTMYKYTPIIILPATCKKMTYPPDFPVIIQITILLSIIYYLFINNNNNNNNNKRMNLYKSEKNMVIFEILKFAGMSKSTYPYFQKLYPYFKNLPLKL